MPRSSKITSEARLRKVAENLLRTNPRPASQLATDLGVSPSHAATLTRDPATKAIAERLLEPHRGRLARLVPKAIRVIERGLQAELPNRKPDHLLRLKAVDRLSRLIELVDDHDDRASELEREPAPPDGEIRGTLEELLLTYRKVAVSAPPALPAVENPGRRQNRSGPVQSNPMTRDWTPEEREKGARWMRMALQARDRLLREHRLRLLAQAKREPSPAATKPANETTPGPPTRN